MLNKLIENLPKINLLVSMLSILLCIVLFVKVSGKVNLEETRKLKLKDVDIIGMTKLKNVKIMDKLQIKGFTFATDEPEVLMLTNSISTGDVSFRIAPGSKVENVKYGYADINIQQTKNSTYGNLKNGTDSDPGSCWVASRWGSACQNPKSS